jgi:glycerate kinase
VPIADGGDGTCAVLVAALAGSLRSVEVRDPLGRPVRAEWGSLAGERAVIDVASASGLVRLNALERDPLRASSYGTGELLRAALDAGAREILLGVGGSATVDGGLGVLAALGCELLDASGAPVEQNGSGLARLARIERARAHPALDVARIEIACDVENPLLGPSGAAAVFAPQKGASSEQVELLERGLTHLAAVIEETTGRDVRTLRFGGAAGGIAAGLHGVLGATLCSGSDRVLERIGFAQALDGAELVITAEGRLDRQSFWHKGPLAVARRAHARGIPTWLLAGSVEAGLGPNAFPELSRVRAIAEGLPLEQAMLRAAELLEAAAERALTEFLAVPQHGRAP